MIGHQHVRVQRAAKAPRELSEVIQEKAVVLLSEETGLTIVPALNDMDRQPGHLQALTTGHGTTRYSSFTTSTHKPLPRPTKHRWKHQLTP